MNVIDSHLHLFKANSKDYPRPVHPGLADEDREVPVSYTHLTLPTSDLV